MGKPRSKGSKAKKRKSVPRLRRLATVAAVVVTFLLAAWVVAGVWFVKHPRAWLDEADAKLPQFLCSLLYYVGNPLGEISDAAGITGHDVVYEYDIEAPLGKVLFAGAPVAEGPPAPDDIQIIDRGHFVIGWSPSLHHPVWVAYHLTPAVEYELEKRPNFSKDRSVSGSPTAGDYTRWNYDRGHMAPNYAIATRYGREAQQKTFLMSNIVPQSANLNRGVWKDFEHRIATVWTRKWGELWVIVGTISETGFRKQTIVGGEGINIDVPKQFYQITVAQTGMDVRVQAVLFDQSISSHAWPTRHLVSIDELEKLSGLDFFPELPSFIQDPLEAECPTRLWPVSFGDLFSLIKSWF